MWKDRIKPAAKGAGLYFLSFLKWLLAAGLLGAACGGVGAGFHKVLELVTEARGACPWLIWLLPAAGVATLLLYRLCRVSFGAGTNLILEAVTENRHVPILLAPSVFVGTALSHLCGASVGREGAALQLGGSIGHNVGRLLRFDQEDVQTLAMCGMAACFSALFGTPLTAAIFVLEVIEVGTVRYDALLPCAAASYAAFTVAGLLGLEPMTFALAGAIPAFSALTALKAAGLAALISALGALFCLCVHGTEHLSKKWMKDPYVRIAVGGALMAILTVCLGLGAYRGAGTDMIELAIAGQAQPLAFLLKILLTALCVGTGFRGGEIVPTLFAGATFGCVVGPLLGLPAGFAAALGMVALFCAVVNCPIASLFLAMELFGTAELPRFVISVAVAFVLSGYYGLYSSQTIVFSKIKRREIRTKTK